jgi:hypothetical protein
MAAKSLSFYSERHAKNWQELKNFLKPFDTNWAFRGQGDSQWGLQTSVERVWPRSDRDVAEQTAVGLYERKASGLRLRPPIPNDSLGTLAEMQHFGAPTRLQDWTKSRYAAAFFAFAEQRDCDCAAIWATNLAWQKAQALSKIKSVLQARKTLTIRDVLHSPAIFDGVVLANKRKFILPVTTFEMNERLGVQQGLFLCPGDVRVSFEDNLRVASLAELKKKWLKFTIPTKYRFDVLEDLRRMNISSASLFPGLDGFARSINADLFLLMNDPATFNKVKGGVSGALIYL